MSSSIVPNLAWTAGGLLSFVAPIDPRAATTSAAITANSARGVRVTIPKTGTLVDLGVFVTSSSGNIDLGVYNTASTTRVKLYSSGSIAASNGWNLVQPNLAVVLGDQVDLVWACDNNTLTHGCLAAASSGLTSLPNGFAVAPLGGLPKLAYAYLTAFPLPASLAEASFVLSGTTSALIARIV